MRVKIDEDEPVSTVANYLAVQINARQVANDGHGLDTIGT